MMVIKIHFQATVIRSSPIQERENTLNLSAHALPPSYRSLMTTDDSRILDFYVDDFDVDTDGKRFIWQGICKFPFIDEERLLDSTKMIKKELTWRINIKIVGGRLIASTLVQERSHLSNGSMDDHNRGSGQMMDGTQINIDVTALGAIIALGLMYLKDSSIRRLDSGLDTQSSLEWHQRIHPSEDYFEKLTGGHMEVEKLIVATTAAAGHLEVEKLIVA
ncbi:unnamed protein product [Lactuca saligna]|uniref:Xrn1 helical domain-containing protein n=1 Tax=Lactuca saligna TaxID=75948 RepID=A0AA35Y114_LACSI|nr:unnamed protein product [Lactuca saligna]